jgi:hypothetical protein
MFYVLYPFVTDILTDFCSYIPSIATHLGWLFNSHVSTSTMLQTDSWYHCTTAHLKSSSSTTNFPWLYLTANRLAVLLGTLLYSLGTDTHNRKRVTWPLLLCYVTANHRNTSRDSYTLLCDVTAHALCSNGPCSDTKETLPQYCCVAHALEGAHRAAAQQCLEQIRHNIFKHSMFRVICNSSYICEILACVSSRMYILRFLYATRRRRTEREWLLLCWVNRQDIHDF